MQHNSVLDNLRDVFNHPKSINLITIGRGARWEKLFKTQVPEALNIVTRAYKNSNQLIQTENADYVYFKSRRKNTSFNEIVKLHKKWEDLVRERCSGKDGKPLIVISSRPTIEPNSKRLNHPRIVSLVAEQWIDIKNVGSRHYGVMVRSIRDRNHTSGWTVIPL